LRILLALIGEQFENSSDICGIVLSVRPKNNFISIWNSNGSDKQLIQSIEETILSVLNLKTRKIMTYKLHMVCLISN